MTKMADVKNRMSIFQNPLDANFQVRLSRRNYEILLASLTSEGSRDDIKQQLRECYNELLGKISARCPMTIAANDHISYLDAKVKIRKKGSGGGDETIQTRYCILPFLNDGNEDEYENRQEREYWQDIQCKGFNCSRLPRSQKNDTDGAGGCTTEDLFNEYPINTGLCAGLMDLLCLVPTPHRFWSGVFGASLDSRYFRHTFNIPATRVKWGQVKRALRETFLEKNETDCTNILSAGFEKLGDKHSKLNRHSYHSCEYQKELVFKKQYVMFCFVRFSQEAMRHSSLKNRIITSFVKHLLAGKYYRVSRIDYMDKKESTGIFPFDCPPGQYRSAVQKGIQEYEKDALNSTSKGLDPLRMEMFYTFSQDFPLALKIENDSYSDIFKLIYEIQRIGDLVREDVNNQLKHAKGSEIYERLKKENNDEPNPTLLKQNPLEDTSSYITLNIDDAAMAKKYQTTDSSQERSSILTPIEFMAKSSGRHSEQIESYILLSTFAFLATEDGPWLKKLEDSLSKDKLGEVNADRIVKDIKIFLSEDYYWKPLGRYLEKTFLPEKNNATMTVAAEFEDNLKKLLEGLRNTHIFKDIIKKDSSTENNPWFEELENLLSANQLVEVKADRIVKNLSQ